jgi:hypothetical protein
MTGKKNEPAAYASASKQAASLEQAPSSAESHPELSSSGIFIKEARIRHFRCLRSVDLELEPLTVLIGQNNSGKTSFLNALFAAIGAGQRIISNDDIFLSKNEVSAPKSSVKPGVFWGFVRVTDLGRRGFFHSRNLTFLRLRHLSTWPI